MRPVRPAHYADSFVATYIISVAAASVAETATYPLDLTKTRLQIQGEAAAANVGGKQTVSLIVFNSAQLLTADDSW
jgi:solute carrier family 25 (mitochondrial uncoupling protein), member 27